MLRPETRDVRERNPVQINPAEIFLERGRRRSVVQRHDERFILCAHARRESAGGTRRLVFVAHRLRSQERTMLRRHLRVHDGIRIRAVRQSTIVSEFMRPKNVFETGHAHDGQEVARQRGAADDVRDKTAAVIDAGHDHDVQPAGFQLREIGRAIDDRRTADHAHGAIALQDDIGRRITRRIDSPEGAGRACQDGIRRRAADRRRPCNVADLEPVNLGLGSDRWRGRLARGDGAARGQERESKTGER